MLLNNSSVTGNSKPITSPQTEIHARLPQLLMRHTSTLWQEPCKQYNHDALEKVKHFTITQRKPIIADMGCGTGESTRLLAELFPQYCVIGIDKSKHRLQKSLQQALPENCLLLRADVFEFLYNSHLYDIVFQAIMLLYPNPWPKSQYIQRRWHGHPTFPALLQLAPYIELRTNWHVYAQEFAFSVEQLHENKYNHSSTFQPIVPLTPFEAKYRNSGHALYRVVVQQDKNVDFIQERLSTLIKQR